MYLEFYGLSEKPFSQTPDPRFLYWNDAYRETLASLSYGIRERKGFIAMIGEAGTGKTTLLRKLLDDMGGDIISVFLFNPNATFEEILEYTLSELGITAPSGRKLAMLQRLNEFLLAAYGEGRNTILLIDEAQDLDSEVLESLRLLSNLETADDKILQIVLSGQPELAAKLADPGLRQLKQRISVRCRLDPLQYDELPGYISARLAVAGGSPDLFDSEAFATIWEFSSGIPRIVNSVCDNALLLGYALGKRTLDAEILREVITDLHKLDADTWSPTPTGETPAPAPETRVEQAPVPPAPEPARAPLRAASAPRPVAARPTRGSRSLAWVFFAVAGLVLLFTGAWLGRIGSDGSSVLPAPGGTDPQSSAAGLAATSQAETATAATTAPAPARAAEPAPAPAAPPPEPVAAPPVLPAAAPAAPAPRGATADTTPPRTAPAARADPVEDLEPPRAARAAVPAVVAPVEEARAEPMPPPSTASMTNDPAEGAGARPVPAPPDPGEARRPVAVAPASPAVTRAPDPPPPAPEERVAMVRASEPPPAAARRGAPQSEIEVAPGDTLLSLAARRYGGSNLTTLDMLRVVNPDVIDVDLIIAGSDLKFPDPGPTARVLPDGGGYAVLALTTETLSRALALQSSLEDRLGRPVALERLATRGGPSVFRVSVRGLSDRGDAAEIANRLGPILRDPSP